MDIVHKIRQSGLPEGQFIVVGSGPLAVLGIILDAADADLAVSPELYEYLKGSGWDEIHEASGKNVLRHDIFDAGIGYGQWGLAELLDDAFYVDGVPFTSLQKTLAWKQAAGRPKDAGHIKLIQEYLRAQASGQGV